MKNSNNDLEYQAVPLVSVESERFNHSKLVKCMIICFCILVVFALSCIGYCYKVNRDCIDKINEMNKRWIDYISQYDFEAYSVDLSTDGGGNANYIGNDGDIINGENGSSESD